MKKIINVFTLGVFLISNIITPLTNFIYAEETETLEEGGDLSVVRDMENIGNDNEVIPQTAPEESGETSTESVETPNPEDSQPEENITPDEQPSEEAQGDEQVNKQEDNQEDSQSDESSVELADPTESHNSAVTPVEDEEENNDTSATQGEQSIDEDREIMGTCPDGETYVDELDKCYNLKKVRIIRNPSGNIIQVNDQEREDLELYFLQSDGITTKHYTVMDRNIGATEPYNQQLVRNSSQVNTGSFGYHYQWGNNYGFKPCIIDPIGSENTCRDLIEDSETTQVPKNEWNIGASKFARNIFVRGWSGWMKQGSTTDNIWGGGSDTINGNSDGTLIGNNNSRETLIFKQGPCPEKYYVPSIFDWLTISNDWKNSTLDGNSGSQRSYDLLMPPAGQRDDQRDVRWQGRYATVLSSTPYKATSDGNWAQNLYVSSRIQSWDTPTVGLGSSARTRAFPVRCAKSSPNPQVLTIYSNGGSKAVIAFTGSFDNDGNLEYGRFTALGTPTRGNHYNFDGWYTDETFTQKVDKGDSVVPELHAKWICEEGYTEKEDKTGCELGPFDVNFNPNGGAFSGMAINEVLKISYSMESLDEIIPIYNIQKPHKNPVGNTSWMFVGRYTKSGIDGDWGDKFDISNPKTNTAYAKRLPSEDLEIYFLQKDGTLTHYTFMDRNMGATEVYNQNQNDPNTASYGYHYQWGNNYGFAPCIGNGCKNFPGGESLSNSQVAITTWDVGPSNFARNIFVGGYNDWRSEVNTSTDNLWGGLGDEYDKNGDESKIGENNSREIVKNRQGPCPEDYYIPSMKDWYQIQSEWRNSSDQDDGGKASSDLLLPFAGIRLEGNGYAGYNEAGQVSSQGTYGYYQSSTSVGSEGSSFIVYSNTYVTGQKKAAGNSIRCTKRTPNDKNLNIHAGGGVYTVISFTGDIGDGKITALGTPVSENFIFEGWYSDADYQHQVNVGDNIPTDLYAKWECAYGGKIYNNYVKDGDGCKWILSGTTLLSGSAFNTTLKTLATGNNITNSSTEDSLIKGFEWRDSLPAGIDMSKVIDISMEGSDYPIYAWFDTEGYENGGGIIYYTSEANKIYMYPDSSNMFSAMKGLTSLNLSKFDTSNVTNMNSIFEGCKNLTELDLSNFDTSNVTTMSYMFAGCSSLTSLDLSHFDTSNVTTMSYMFASCSSLTELDLSHFDTSNVTDMQTMFASCSSLTELDLSHFDTSNVTALYSMFAGCSNLTSLNLDNWDLSNLPGNNYGGMFGGASSLKTLSLKNWKTPKSAYQLVSAWTPGLSANLDWIDVSGWDLSKTEDASYLFAGNKTKEIRGLNTWKNMGNINNMYEMFYNCSNLSSLNLDNWDTSSVTNMSLMFYNCSNLTSLNLSHFDTSSVTNMNSMFNSCSKLTGLNLDNWDLSSIIMSDSDPSKIGGMFSSANNLKTLSLRNWTIPETFVNTLGGRSTSLSANLDWIDVSNWDLNKTKNISGLFGSSYAHEIRGLDTWDVSNIENMNYLFQGCSNNLTGLNLDNWDLSNSPSMTNMFQGANGLKWLSLKNWKIPTSFRNILGGATDTSSRNNLTAELDWIDVTNWDLSATEDLSGLFGDNKTREIRGLGTWDTSNVKDMSEMFAGTPRLTALDLSNWDTSNVENMTYMFVASSALKTIYASEKFVTTKATDVINSMFAYTALVGGQGTVYDWNHAGTDYAKIDGGPHNPGYFTQANSIRYDLDGGELQHPKTAYAPIGSFTLSEPTKEGYTFIGWTGSNGDVPQREVTIQQGTIGDLEFTANWEINKHQIIFDTDGGETLNPLEVEYNSELSGFQLPIPIRESYRFLGWEGLPNIMPDEDITIKALWERVNNEPQYSGGGGGGNSSAIDVAEKTIDNNKHNAADEKRNNESRTPDGKQGDTDSSVEDNYSPEFIEAYNFAKTNGITTQSNIQKAKMNSPLTRIAMAKMLSYYAINVLGQEPDMSKTINFDDVSAKRDAEYDNGVTLAYQLGIMGINMKNNKFRPNDEVTRAEFTTALSRMIYGMRDGTGKMKYYEPHMARLYNEGIINETNPKMKEKRGYVMIMLMRTVK